MDFKSVAKNNKILEINVGSHLFGTSTPDSDIDLLGIFMPSDDIVYGFQQCEEVDLGVVDKDDTGRNTKEAVDFKIHEYRKFVRLAMQNNPNILHVLFVDEKNIRFQNEYGKKLLANASMFPHKGAHHRFVKYAHSQMHKMWIKPANYAALERGLVILDDFQDHKVLADVVNIRSLQGLSCPFVDSGRGKHVKCGDLHFERGVFVKKARKMIKARLERATNRYTLFTKHGYDPKFASNLIQLLNEGIELMKTGVIKFPLAYADEIIDVKNGRYTVEEILQWGEQLTEEARVAYEKSDLPENPRSKKIEKFVIGEVRRFLE